MITPLRLGEQAGASFHHDFGTDFLTGTVAESGISKEFVTIKLDEESVKRSGGIAAIDVLASEVWRPQP